MFSKIWNLFSNQTKKYHLNVLFNNVYSFIVKWDSPPKKGIEKINKYNEKVKLYITNYSVKSTDDKKEKIINVNYLVSYCEGAYEEILVLRLYIDDDNNYIIESKRKMIGSLTGNTIMQYDKKIVYSADTFRVEKLHSDLLGLL